MVIDHGPHFDLEEMEYLTRPSVGVQYSLVMTPSSNGLAERTYTALVPA